MTRLLTMALSAILCMGIAALIVGNYAVAEKPASAEMVANLPTDGKPKGVMFAADSGDGKITEIARDSSGQFHLKARVNRNAEDFLIDTGADVVAITIETAEEAGLPVDPTAFTPLTQTASGPGLGARFVVDEFEVAGKTYRDVEVIVLEGLEVNLLGQSLLRRMGKVEMHGDRMRIERE